MLSKLSRTCVCNVPTFEMMVERTPAIIGVNLRMYRVNNNVGKYTVTESLTNSSNSNENNGPNSLEKVYIYKNTLVPFLKGELTAMGIPFKLKNTKPVLYKAFIRETRKRQ